MPTLNDLLAILVVAGVIVLVIAIFVRTSMSLRKGGGSITTTVLGATHEMLTKDQRKAAETIVNVNAGKRLDEQRSGEPPLGGAGPNQE
jgi:hypothetical protein